MKFSKMFNPAYNRELMKKKVWNNKERNKKVSISMLGNINGSFRKDIKHTQETKDKISASKKGTVSFRKGTTLIDEYGKERADKIREKYRANAINTLNKLKVSKVSKAELILKNYFKRNNFKYVHQWKYKLGVADFYLPDYNMIVECDGSYWHSKPDYIKRDKVKREWLKQNGYAVLVLTSENITKMEKNFNAN